MYEPRIEENQPTCKDPEASGDADDISDGCICIEGYLLSEGKCIHKSDCGCKKGDMYYDVSTYRIWASP